MTTYDVTVTREDDAWVADIHGAQLGPAATDVDRFADLDVEVRDLIAGLTDTDPDSIDLTWQYVIDGVDVTKQIDALVHAEAEYAEVSHARQAAREQLLQTLSGETSLPQSAIGDVLGLSHQRVHQLLHAS